MVAIRAVSSSSRVLPERLLGGLQSLDVVAIGDGQGRHGLDKALELFVAGDEVGLGIDFDHGAGSALGGDGHQTFGGDAAGLLGGSGQTLLAQPVDRGFDVASGLGQRLLAVHHAGAGLLAQFLDKRGGNLGHGHPLSKIGFGNWVS